MIDKEAYKHFGIKVLKYAPCLLALSISAKMHLIALSNVQRDACLLAVNWINCIATLCFIFLIYSLGKCLGFCWKHQALCRCAFWGDAFFAFFLLVKVPSFALVPLTTAYVIAMLIFSFIYSETK